jgi:hypothetical protein
MKATLIKRLEIDGREVHVRKDTQLLLRPDDRTSVIVNAKPPDDRCIELNVRPDWPVHVVEGQDRVIIYLSDFIWSIETSGRCDGPKDFAGWLNWWMDFGFNPSDEFESGKLSPWSVVSSAPAVPVRPSPCCGCESYEVGLAGTAVIYACQLCGHRFHYSGRHVIKGLPMQQEPGVPLDDAFAGLDPTASAVQPPAPKLDPGFKLDPNAGHGAADGYGGSDYGP